MDQSSSDIIKRLGHWQTIQEPLPKSSLSAIENVAEETTSTQESGGEVEGEGSGEAEEGGEEEENPALEGHFLLSRQVVVGDVVVVDSCECQCHREAQPVFELSLPFSCSKCSQQFCCKCQFVVHRDFHRGERKYSCQVCNKSYYYKSDLVRHLPSHSDVKPHLCKVCGRTFNQVGHLITHRLVHTGEKPFPCDVCHKHFNRKSNLQKHKMIHTGERPFMCLVCGSRFGRKGDLQRHMMLHTGERPFKCDLCSKSFSQKPHLLSHMAVHTGERQYKCLACAKSFNRKNNLVKHQLTKCPGLSLRRDGSDLSLSDLGFSLFTQTEEAKSYYANLKTLPATDNTSDNQSSRDGTDSDLDAAADASSLLRARLSNPRLPLPYFNILDFAVRSATNNNNNILQDPSVPLGSKLENALLRSDKALAKKSLTEEPKGIEDKEEIKQEGGALENTSDSLSSDCVK